MNKTFELPSVPEDETLLDAREVAAFLKCSVPMLYRREADGSISVKWLWLHNKRVTTLREARHARQALLSTEQSAGRTPPAPDDADRLNS